MNSSTLQAALFEALDAIRAGYPEQAVTACNELLAVYPDSVRVYRVRAQAYEGMEDWRHASEDFNRVLDIVPTDAHASVSLARTMHKLGRTEEAQLIARQALDYAPTDEDALALAQNMDDSDAAALKPPQPGRVLMMRQQFDFGRVGRALESLRKFAAERPHRIDARTVLAELLWRSHARIAAAELCQQILDEQPDSLPANTLLAIIWAKLGAPRVSEAHLRVLDRLDPDHRETREWLGDLSPVTVADVPARPTTNLNAVDLVEDEHPTGEVVGVGNGDGVGDVNGEDDAEHDNYVNDFIVNVGPISPQSQPTRGWQRRAAMDDGDGDSDGYRDSANADDIVEEFSPLEWERDTELLGAADLARADERDSDSDVNGDIVIDVDGNEVNAEGSPAKQPNPNWLKNLRKAGPPEPEGAPSIGSLTPPKSLTHFKFESAQSQTPEHSTPHQAETERNVEVDDADDLAIGDIEVEVEVENEALAKTELSMLPVTPNALLDTVEIELPADSTVESGRVSAEANATDRTQSEDETEKVIIIAPVDRGERPQRRPSTPEGQPAGTGLSQSERRIQQQSAGLN